MDRVILEGLESSAGGSMSASERVETMLRISADTAGARALQVLLSRRSVGLLRDPVPSDEELALILDAGLCAPDHGWLRPWRFVLIRDAARAMLAELLIEALGRREENPPASIGRRLHRNLIADAVLRVQPLGRRHLSARAQRDQ